MEKKVNDTNTIDVEKLTSTEEIARMYIELKDEAARNYIAGFIQAIKLVNQNKSSTV